MSLWTKYCRCGRGVPEAVVQCSYCDELDAKLLRQKAAIQLQHRLDRGPVPSISLFDAPKVAELLNRSFHVSRTGNRLTHLGSYQGQSEDAGFLQEVLGGYVYDRSLWDDSGWSWNSRGGDIRSVIQLIWPLLGGEKQLYLVKLNLAT